MTPYYHSQGVTIYHGDSRQVLEQLPDESVHCVVTSPPYWGLRDYGDSGQMGLEDTPDEYIKKMVEVMREVRRVLRKDGTLWLNVGDSYANSTATIGGYSERSTLQGYTGEHTKGRKMSRSDPNRPVQHGLKQKDLCGIPWRLALALQADGWWLRQDIIWHKPNPMPESCTDRCTKAHEYVFLMTKAARYYYDADAVREKQTAASLKRYEHGFAKAETNKDKRAGYLSTKRGTESATVVPNDAGRNRRSVWTIPTAPYPGAHFATFPPALVEPCIKAGCPEGGTVLDPFMGSGTAGQVAVRHSCEFIGIELSEDYIQLALGRFKQQVLF